VLPQNRNRSDGAPRRNDELMLQENMPAYTCLCCGHAETSRRWKTPPRLARMWHRASRCSRCVISVRCAGPDPRTRRSQIAARRRAPRLPLRPENGWPSTRDDTNIVNAYRAAEPEDVRTRSLIAGTADLRACSHGRVQGVTRGDGHDASCAPPHRRTGSPEEEPARGTSVVGGSGGCRSAPTVATALRASSRLVSARSCSVAVVR
jgi:hypothetical protein